MKKNVVSLLLILALCLGLCACGSDSSDALKTAVCGIWHEREYQKSGENPGYFQLKEDGTGTFNGKDAFTWTGRQDREDEFLWTVTIEMESGEKHTLELYTGERDYLESWLTLEKDGPIYCYLKAGTEVRNPWFADLQTTWYVRDTDAAVQTVELNADGTVKLDGMTCFWTDGTDWVYDENSVHLYLYNEQGICGMLEAFVLNSGLYDFRFQDYSTNRGYSYYDHPLLQLLDNGSWESFDRFFMIDDYFLMGPWYESITIGEEAYTVQFDTKADKDTLTVNFLDGDTIRYAANVFMDGEYPMATLTDCQSGQQTLYFNNYYGYNEGNPDALYYQTINLVYRYANNSSIYTLETEEYLDSDERLPYIYQKLTGLNGDQRAQEFLDRFTVVPDVLTDVIRYDTDQLNNVHENPLARYHYDQNGVMIAGFGEDIIEKFGVNDNATQYFTYDAKGRIAEIQVGTGTVYALGTPIFDTAGKMVGMHVREQNDDYTTVFTFDVKGRVVRMGVSEDEAAYPLIYHYTYDDAGRLITKVKTTGYHGNVIITRDYTYNGDVLAEIKEYHQEWNNYYSTTYTYKCDEQGRPLSAVINTNDPNNACTFQEIRYIYKDLYFFDSTGLVLGSN